jgi:hypothetical protein
MVEDGHAWNYGSNGHLAKRMKRQLRQPIKTEQQSSIPNDRLLKDGPAAAPLLLARTGRKAFDSADSCGGHPLSGGCTT